MKAVIFRRYGNSSEVEIAERPRPAVGPKDILVQVHAVGLNPIDTMIPKGSFRPLLAFDLPAVIGSDLAGTVVEAGREVRRFKPGDAVFASVFDQGRGSLADLVAVPEPLAALKPASLDFVEAASIPMVGLTVWQALRERAALGPGQKIFIPAGSGGIGSVAIQLARHLGAHVGTTTSTGNIELVRSLGADEIVDYRKQDFETVLQGYDLVLGTLRGDNLEKALRILKPGGSIVSLVGPPDAAFARARKLNAALRLVFGLMSWGLRRRAKRRGIGYAFHFMRPDGGQLAAIGDLIEAGRLRPVIDKVFPFDQAKAALAYLETGRARGKVVVRLR